MTQPSPEQESVLERPSAKKKPPRLVSLDAYRGFVMLLMASDGFEISRVASHFPNSEIWRILAHQFDHVQWLGCGLWDLIQPSFMFMVGVALPYSLASRRTKGEAFSRMLFHAIWRAFLLIALGVLLRSVGQRETYFTFEDALAQIGLGYVFLFLLGWTKPRTQWIAAAVILFGYWLAFALYPLPGANFHFAAFGASADWAHLHGFAAHWDKGVNFGNAVDRWFLNLFPRENPFVFNSGGYVTLNFVPSLATMIFGLLAGQCLRSSKTLREKFTWLVGAGIVGIAIGSTLNATGICPSVKRIWTSSWTIYSAGWACLFLATFYALIDIRGWKRWAFPCVAAGMNSIAMYLMANLSYGFISSTIRTNLEQNFFEIFGKIYTPMFQSFCLLFSIWLICLWMYRRKIFLRI